MTYLNNYNPLKPTPDLITFKYSVRTSKKTQPVTYLNNFKPFEAKACLNNI
jgi:hypothetical protein